MTWKELGLHTWKKLQGTIFLVGYWWLGWAGTHGERHAGNVFMFLCWILLATTWILVFAIDQEGEFARQQAQSRHYSLPHWIGILADCLGMTLLAYYGWFVMASLTLLQMVGEGAIEGMLRKIEKDIPQQPATSAVQ